MLPLLRTLLAPIREESKACNDVIIIDSSSDEGVKTASTLASSRALKKRNASSREQRPRSAVKKKRVENLDDNENKTKRRTPEDEDVGMLKERFQIGEQNLSRLKNSFGRSMLGLSKSMLKLCEDVPDESSGRDARHNAPSFDELEVLGHRATQASETIKHLMAEFKSAQEISLKLQKANVRVQSSQALARSLIETQKRKKKDKTIVSGGPKKKKQKKRKKEKDRKGKEKRDNPTKANALSLQRVAATRTKDNPIQEKLLDAAKQLALKAFKETATAKEVGRLHASKESMKIIETKKTVRVKDDGKTNVKLKGTKKRTEHHKTISNKKTAMAKKKQSSKSKHSGPRMPPPIPPEDIGWEPKIGDLVRVWWPSLSGDDEWYDGTILRYTHRRFDKKKQVWRNWYTISYCGDSSYEPNVGIDRIRKRKLFKHGASKETCQAGDGNVATNSLAIIQPFLTRNLRVCKRHAFDSSREIVERSFLSQKGKHITLRMPKE